MTPRRRAAVPPKGIEVSEKHDYSKQNPSPALLSMEERPACLGGSLGTGSRGAGDAPGLAQPGPMAPRPLGPCSGAIRPATRASRCAAGT